MKITKQIIGSFLAILLISSCSFGKKENKSSDCEGCPEAISIDIPTGLEKNSDAKVFVADAELMFNKWAKRGYLLAKDIEEMEQIDSTEMSFSESMKAGSIALKMVGYFGEFVGESVAMNERMEELKSTMSDDELEDFNEVIAQFEAQMEEIAVMLEEMGLDSPSNKQDVMDMMETSETEE